MRGLVPGRDFDTDEHAHNIVLTEARTDDHARVQMREVARHLDDTLRTASSTTASTAP